MTPHPSRHLDAKTLDRWYTDHASRLKAFVFGVVRDRSQAEEIVQATFAKAVTHGGDVQPGSERAWLFQVAYREAKLLHRKQQAESRAVINRLAANRSATNRSSSESAEIRPEERLLRTESVVEVRQALESLPEEQQDVVRLRIYEERTFQEIADLLELPLGTVLTRMRLALKTLKQALKSHDNPPHP
ncbi:MAG: RNA polymerase sigma factor [Planctomycetaceae bacterium]|nr:RNA polymerase sigma factor [Planctomycetaceae bacterium]